MLRYAHHIFACGSVVVLCLGAVPARAAGDEITTTISGYGTIAGTFTDSAASEYRNSSEEFKGASKHLDLGVESRLGVQGVVTFGPQLSVTAQVLAARRGDKDFDIGAEWVYGQYKPTPGIDLRLGRVVLPVYLISESRNVGYAAPWLRVPVEVYQPMPYTTLDGVQGAWRVNLGSTTLTTQLSYGSVAAKLQTPIGPLNATGHDVVNLAFSAESGNWTARLAQTLITSPTSLPVGPGVSIDYSIKDRFLTTGIQYDNGKAIVMSEWARRTENNVPGLGLPLAATTSWYVAAGWRFDALTPMVRYASYKNDGSVIAFPKTSSVGLSLRYDVVRNVALKLQLDRYDASNIAAFVSPSATSGSKVNVVGFGADFVF